jgi:4-aminobutyrate aminotransferase-like enzyme
MIAIEGHKTGFGVELMNRLIDQSVIAIPCGPGGSSLAITPALNIKEEELFKALDIIIQTI